MDLVEPHLSADPLGQALHHVHMSGVFYCRSELTAPWGLTLPPLPGYLWFHVVAAGELRLEGGDDEMFVPRGDMVLVTDGAGHTLRSDVGAPVPGILELEREQVSERYEVLRHGGGGAATKLICGAVHFDHAAARSLVDALPPFIHIEASPARPLEPMRSTLALIAAETARPQPGGEAIITRLSDVLVIQAIRAWMESDPSAKTGWLGALRDPQVGRALALVHGDPSRPWTVAELAAELAMSRSAFSARFTELVGVPVIQYVTCWRMRIARGALERDGATVAELADRLGYGSEAAFARAFKRVVGAPPGRVRRAADGRDPITELAAAAG